VKRHVNDLHSGKAKYSSILITHLTWADIGADRWLVDGAAIINQVMLTRTIYGTLCKGDGEDLQRRKFSPAPGF
jgi:ring-1,2-phenylacetyl-CoA epoxidase subunit PaaA